MADRTLEKESGMSHIEQLAAALRIHHDWSVSNMPGYSEAGAEAAAYRATVAALAKVTPHPQGNGKPGDVAGRRIVCAAIRAADGEVLLGIRHYSADMHRQIEGRRDGEKFTHRHDEDQGFIDQRGVYLTREEAYQVAQAEGQIVRPHACGEGLDGPKLYSEGLY